MADKFAIITGASTGIGAELARLAAADGYDLLLVADTPFVDPSVGVANARTLEVDLATLEVVDRLLDAAGGRRIDLLCANAGHGRRAVSRPCRQRLAPCHRHQCDGHRLPVVEDTGEDGGTGRRQGAGHRLNRGLDAGQLLGGL